MNKVRRLAEDLVNKHPTLFSGDFDKNKLALNQVTVIRTRSIRNQLAGAITKLIHERGPIALPEEEQPSGVSGAMESQKPAELPTLEERVRAEGAAVPSLEAEQQGGKEDELKSKDASSKSEVASGRDRAITENKPITQ